jgi:hypothetical protein
MLHNEFDHFFKDHLFNLGYLVDGNKYNFAFTIQHSNESENCIKAVSTTIIKGDSE